MEPSTVSLIIKITGSNETLPLIVPYESTVETIKALISDNMDSSPENLILIYKGKQLPNDSTLAEHSIKDNSALYLVKTVPKATQPRTAPTTMSTGTGEMTGMLTGLNHFGVMSQANEMLNELPDLGGMSAEGALPPGNLEFLRTMMTNPETRRMVISMMENMLTNPSARDWMINSNPQLKEMVARHPEMKEALGNPTVIRHSMSMLERMGLGSAEGPLSGQPENFPMPGSGGPAPPASAPVQPVPQFTPWTATPPRELYSAQLVQLRELGFIHEETNLQVLQATGGNVEAAVERLLNMLG